ncbi:hypothetical protein CPB83DRAFT_860965 [Crepidotus variabilis]|uniref:Uncharacterized protein n=1 Tax=Crepidotus variabilis TaxID=179855 RepID=A0A9P6JL76_9AGAR|nr:hypothetical protein CPB83DRAFT_860965 [Crepidotus variabilis]
MKQYWKAQQLLEESTDNKMHAQNPIFLASEKLLVDVYIGLGEGDKAEKMQESVVEAMTKSCGYDSEKLIPELEHLANIYQKSNQLGKRHRVKLRLLRYR